MSALKELQNYTFTSKYARWDKDKQRRETWTEAVNRVRNMMLTKYADKNIDDDINWVYDMMQKKKVLGSQRCLSFAGKPIFDKPLRTFNCTCTYIDRLRAFQEYAYALLAGAGVGISIQYQHVNKLPTFSSASSTHKTFVIPDNIEGWSDSFGVLLSSYFKNPVFPEYADSIVSFDFSEIRKQGSELSSGVGVAPGPDGLKHSLKQVRLLLNRCVRNEQKRLKPIDTLDICCHISDCVLSGGIRRSSTLALFSLEDKETMQAKIGNWLQENPQRARSNNSVALLRDKVTFEEFENIIQYTKEYGEPGFVWVDDLNYLVNPCLPKWATILTPNGISTIENINIGDEIWSSEGWTKVTNKWSTGINEVYKYETTGGRFLGTKNHRIVSNKNKTEVDQASSIDILTGDHLSNSEISSIIDKQSLIDGLVLGDGSVHKASNNLVFLHIGKDDVDYFTSEISNYIVKARPGLSKTSYEVITTLSAKEIDYTYSRIIPKRYFYAKKHIVASFLRGLYSANGSICGRRVTLKATSKSLIEQVQILLSSMGIKSYYTLNKPKKVEFENGEYECKQSYDLNISTDIKQFAKYIGFIQRYKNKKLDILLEKRKNQQRKRTCKKSFDITHKELISEEETFDITVDNNSHTYWCNGCNVSNCNEIGMYPVDVETGKSGFQGCNLSTINCSNLKDEDDFYERVRAATIIGTLQAGFTDINYLDKVSRKIFEKEALLGVSMTGMMENSDIVLNNEIQRKGAKLAKATNKQYAQKIGINPGARITTVKPEGSASCMLGTSSGIHPHHAKRYIRRVQANKTENVYNHFSKQNKHACEQSVWSASGIDDVILFPIEVPDGSKTKNQLSALKMLEIVRDTKRNWIDHGKNEELCIQPWLTHNISNTVVVKPDEWEGVTKYIYKYRKDFSGVSLLSMSGDKDYPQAPFTSVYTSREIVKEYGEAAIWCSGLIELALLYFENNLWAACDSLLNDNFLDLTYHNTWAKNKDGRLVIVSSERYKLGCQQIEWWEKARKFAKRYFDDNIVKLSYCLKDVHNWKLYNDLKDSFVPVDYTKLIETDDYTKPEEEIACSGGACLI